jgi:uncharacterized Zn finger protein (UPF0148 family)
MSFCASCGTQLTAEAAFCPQCGTQANAKKDAGHAVASSDTPQAEQEFNRALNKNEAKKQIDQVMLGFVFVLFCAFKGADKVQAIQNPMETIIPMVIIAAVVYFFASIMGLKKSKPMPVLAMAIMLGVLYGIALLFGDNSENNFFDWFSYLIGAGQIWALYQAHNLIKSEISQA